MPLDARAKRPSTTGVTALHADKSPSTALAPVPSSRGRMSKFARTAPLNGSPWLSGTGDDPRLLQIRSWRLLRAETADARVDATTDFGALSTRSARRGDKRHGSAGGFHTASGGMFDPFDRGAEVFGRQPQHFECASRRFARGARGELHFRTLCHSSTRLKVMREACGSDWAVESLDRLNTSVGPRSLSPLSRTSSPHGRHNTEAQRSTSPKTPQKAQRQQQLSPDVQLSPLSPLAAEKASSKEGRQTLGYIASLAHARKKSLALQYADGTALSDDKSPTRHWRKLQMRQGAVRALLHSSSSSISGSRTLTTTLTANSQLAGRHVESLTHQQPLYVVYSTLMTKYGGLYGALYSENSMLYKEEYALTTRQWCDVLQNNLHLCSAGQARLAFESFGELDASGMITVLEFTSFLESVSPMTSLMGIRRRMVRSQGSILAGIRALAEEVHNMGLGILPAVEKKTHCFDAGSLQAAWYRTLRKHEFLAIVEKVVGFTMDEATTAWKMLHISGTKHLTLFELACALQSISPLLVVEDSRLVAPPTDNCPKRAATQWRRASDTGNIVRRGSTQKKVVLTTSAPISNLHTACPCPSDFPSANDPVRLTKRGTVVSLNTSSGSGTSKWRTCTDAFSSIGARSFGDVMFRSGMEPWSLASVRQPTVIGADHRSSTTRSTVVTGQTKQTLRSCMPHPFLEGFRLFLSRRGAGCDALRRVLQEAMDAQPKGTQMRTEDIVALMRRVGIPPILTSRFFSLLGFETEGEAEKKGDRLGLVEFERLLGVYAPQGALYEVADELINSCGSLEAALITNPIFEEMGAPWDKPDSLLNQAQLAKVFGKLLTTPPAHFPFLWTACDANGDGWVTLRGVFALLDALLLVEVQQRDQKIRGLCSHAARHMKRSFRQFHRSVDAAVQQAREPLYSTTMNAASTIPEPSSTAADDKKKSLKNAESMSCLPELLKRQRDMSGSNTTSSGDRSKNRDTICYDVHQQEHSFRQTQFVNTVKWV